MLINDPLTVYEAAIIAGGMCLCVWRLCDDLMSLYYDLKNEKEEIKKHD